MPALSESLTLSSSSSLSVQGAPTSAEDAGSNRLSWSSIRQKWFDRSGTSPDHQQAADSQSLSSSLSSQTDTDSLDDVSLSDSDLFCDPQDQLLCLQLLKVIEHSLTKAKESSLRCFKLLIPDQLMAHIGQEILHLSVSEPCGLRGALIDVCMQQESTLLHMEQISVDPSLVPTFQLTLVLRLDSGLWPRIQDLFTSGPSFTPGYRQALRLSTRFRVIKKKLYSSEELLIEEC